jgi:hypothetical protein
MDVKDEIKANQKNKLNNIHSPEYEAIQNSVIKGGEDYQLGTNSPNLRYCCGPSGYCKPCKDQSTPAQTGTVALPLWIQQLYGK